MAGWKHSEGRQQWELHDGTELVGSIADEYLEAVERAGAWDDKPRIGRPFELVPGFASVVADKFRVPLPPEARPAALLSKRQTEEQA